MYVATEIGPVDLMLSMIIFSMGVGDHEDVD